VWFKADTVYSDLVIAYTHGIDEEQHCDICDILYCDIILLYIDFLTILFSFDSFILLVKLVRSSPVFIKGNLAWLDYEGKSLSNMDSAS